RDPRDVLISAIDHGKKLVAAGETHTFAKMVDFDKALPNLLKWINIWEHYAATRGIVRVKYEDLLANPKTVIDRITAYLNLVVRPQDVDDILWKYNKENQQADMTGLHFNKAMIGRYKDELSKSQRIMMDESLHEHI